MIEAIESALDFLPAGLVTLIIIVGKILVLVLPLMGAVAYLTLAERKVIGYMQVRIGPNRVGPRGLLQPIADAVKLMFKERFFQQRPTVFCLFPAHSDPGTGIGCMGCCPV